MFLLRHMTGLSGNGTGYYNDSAVRLLRAYERARVLESFNYPIDIYVGRVPGVERSGTGGISIIRNTIMTKLN